MIALGAIKESFRLFYEHKALWGISFVLATTYALVSRLMYIPSLEWLRNFYLALYTVVSEIILVNAVLLILESNKLEYGTVVNSLKKNGWRAFSLLVLYFVVFTILFVMFTVTPISFDGGLDSLMFYAPILIALLLFFLLPYYFSVRFAIMQNTKIWKSVFETLKLYVGRIFDTATLAFFSLVVNVILFGAVFFLAFYILRWFGGRQEPSLSLSVFAKTLSSSVGVPLSVLSSSISTLLVSSSITIYFWRLEELGEFDG